MPEILLETDYVPHAGQRKLHDSTARFRICTTGRRWGKTLAATWEIINVSVTKPRSTSMWVAPSYDQSRIAWEMVGWLPEEVVARRLESTLDLWLVNRSHIKFRSADKPKNLRGFGLDFLVVDEAAFIAKDLWDMVMRPALSDREGRALFTGTPRGKNWFYELFTRGQDDLFPDFESFVFPSVSNPYLNPVEIEAARRELPELVFKQEYLAEFLDEGAGVFRNIKGCVRGELGTPKPDWQYCIGIDLGKHVDFTVITVLDKFKNVVGWERYNQIEWPFQKSRIIEAVRRWNNAAVLIDSTGIGDPIFDDLRRIGLNVQGYQFTNESKKNLIEALAVDIEQGRVHYPEITELVNELEIFGYEITRAGNVRYGAPEGYHDDCVISLALANWLMRSPIITQDQIRHVGF